MTDSQERPAFAQVAPKFTIEPDHIRIDMTPEFWLDMTADQAENFGKALILYAYQARGQKGHVAIIPIVDK